MAKKSSSADQDRGSDDQDSRRIVLDYIHENKKVVFKNVVRKKAPKPLLEADISRDILPAISRGRESEKKDVFNFVAHVFSFAFVVFFCFYFLFSVALLDLDIDNKLTRLLSAHLPVPVVISNFGFIEYFEHKDLSGGNIKEADIIKNKFFCHDEDLKNFRGWILIE